MQDIFYTAIGIIAILLHVIVNFNILREARNKLSDNLRSYRMFLIIVLVYYISDTLWGILHGYRQAALLYLDTVINFGAMAFSISWYCKFVVEYMGLNNAVGKLIKIFGKIFTVCLLGLLIYNHFDHIFFWVDNNAVYTAYGLRDWIHCSQMLFFGIMAVQCLSFMSSLDNITYRNGVVFFLYSMIMMLCVLVQLFFPLLPMYCIGLLIGTTLFHIHALEYDRKG